MKMLMISSTVAIVLAIGAYFVLMQTGMDSALSIPAPTSGCDQTQPVQPHRVLLGGGFTADAGGGVI